MTAMRIAMVLNSLGRGGVPEVARQLLVHLSKDGIEPFLYILKDDAKTADRERLAEGFRQSVVELAVGERSAGKIERIAHLAEWLAERRIDILHTHSYRPNIFGRMAGLFERARGLGMIAHYHNDYDDKWLADPTMLAIERRLAGSTDAFVAVSNAVAEHVGVRLECDPSKLFVIANSIEPEQLKDGNREGTRRTLGIASDRFVLAVIGRICEQKGQTDFVEALAHLQSRPLILMAGDIENKGLYARLQERLREIGWQDDVRFLGHFEDMAGLLAASDGVVTPSLWEGLPLTLLEAMAAAKPIVATAIPSIVETTGDEAALLTPPRNPVALAQAIDRIVADDNLRQTFAERGSERVKGQSWAGAAEQLMAIYRDVAKQ